MCSAKKSTYFSLQAGRGLASWMVVMFHVTTFMGGDARYWHRQWLSHSMMGLALGVEYFFVLSGAVILLAHRKDIGRASTVRSYVWKRFRRVYPIYWLVLVPVVLGYMLRPGVGAAWEREPGVIASGFLLLSLGREMYHLNLPVAWTLFHEVLFYAVFVVLLLQRRVGAWVMGVWLGLSVWMLIWPWGLYTGIYLFSPLHLLFGFGMLVAYLLREGKVGWPWYLTVMGGVLFIGAVALAGFAPDYNFMQELMAGVGAALLVVGTARLEEQGKLHVPGWMKFLGDASYAIYLVHYPLFMAVMPVVYRAWLKHPLPLAVPFIALTALALGLGCAVHAWVERPLLRLLPVGGGVRYKGVAA